jgi:hypothetical protein
MSPPESLRLLSAAIVLAGAFVGAGLYFGLRASSPQAVPSTASAFETSAPLSSSPSAQLPSGRGALRPSEVLLVPGANAGPTPPIAPAEVQSSVERAVRARFDELRPSLRERCWEPSARSKAEPKAVRYDFNFTFDAGGKQLARGLRERCPEGVESTLAGKKARCAGRPDVRDCVTAALPAFEVPAQGTSVFVDVPLVLP